MGDLVAVDLGVGVRLDDSELVIFEAAPVRLEAGLTDHLVADWSQLLLGRAALAPIGLLQMLL